LKFNLTNEKLSLEEIYSEAVKCYMKLDNDLFEVYMEQKIEPIIGVIEPSMYLGKFNWDQAPEPIDSEARDYIKEIIINIISVHAEITRLLPRDSPEIKTVTLKLVEAITEEINRIFTCISQMNSNGCVQALIDLNLVRTSLQPFLSTASKQFLKEATNSILDLQEGNNF